MEKIQYSCIFFHAIILASILLVSRGVNTKENNCTQKIGSSYSKLFVFGDSYADTGNLGKLDREFTHSWYDPYGITFPGKPIGRFSNGRVLTDFVASFIGIKSPVPYKVRKAGPNVLQHGMNFAVGGSGVFDTGSFQRNLSIQIDLLKQQIDLGFYSACDLEMSVGLMAVSGNDYSYVAARDNNTSAALDYVPLVVKQMKADIKRILSLGITKLIVTNLHPLGCTPYLSRALNFTDCDALANIGVLIHNTALKNMLNQLDNTTNSRILLLDLNDPFYNIVSQVNGVRRFENARRPCCEGFTKDNYCGEQDEKGNKKYALCANRDEHFYWDDVHPTQAGWTAVSESIRPIISRFLFQ
ncbi:hypothetical protein LUZ60_016052 [Juncus effusus]|nr:hypothetical protein LUZ60_016052 [Juncus effusus]